MVYGMGKCYRCEYIILILYITFDSLFNDVDVHVSGIY